MGAKKLSKGNEKAEVRMSKLARRLHVEELLDEGLEESFPASDPPSIASNSEREAGWV